MPRNCFVILMLLLACGAEARTWYVEKDGSGDYTVIQDAADMAAPGDTIRVGAGRFDDYETYSTSPYPNGVAILVHVWCDSLTIIGEGPEKTIIGPEAYLPEGHGPCGIYGPTVYPVLRVENLAFENLNYGMHLSDGNRTVIDCRLLSCGIGVYSFADQGMLVEGCNFEHNQFNGLITHNPARDITVRNCQFLDSRSNVSFNSTPNANVYDCMFTGGRGGVSHQDGSSGGVYDCRFDDVENFALIVNTGSATIAERNVIVGGDGNLTVHTNAQMLCIDNILSGGLWATISVINAELELHNNHILNAGGYSVLVEGHSGPPIVEYDLTGNYWGTAEADSIDAWIYDHNDTSPANPFGVINYEPFSSAPLPTQQETQGGLRKMFR